MARERTLKVTILGDASDLEKRLDKLGDSVAETSKEIEDIGKSTTKASKEMSKGFDGIRDGADDSERRITGFRDSLTGTQDVMKGLKDGDMVALSTGFADLASSVANLGADMLEWGKKAYEGAKNVVAAHGASVVAKSKDIAATVAHKAASLAATVATQAQAAAQWLLNAAMSANPIVLVVAAIAALTAGVIIAYRESETFRNIVDAVGRFFRDTFIPIFEGAWEILKSAFGWVRDNWPLLLAIMTGPIGLAVLAIVKNWDTIKDGFTAVKTWIGDRIDDIVGFVTGMPARIASAAVGMWDGITAAFKSAMNTIIRGWNQIEFKIPGFSVGPIGYNGFTLGVPDIPTLHSGGTFRSPNGPGTSGMAWLQDGERVSRGGAGGSGVTIIVQGSMIGTERELVSILKRAQRDGLTV